MQPVVGCPLCSSTESRLLLNELSGSVHTMPPYMHCNRCGGVFIRQDIERHVTKHDDGRCVKRQDFLAYTRYKTEINIYRKTWLHNVLRDSKWNSEERKALDIGCKDGSFLKLLKDDGWAVIGIEPNASYAALASEIYGLEIKNDYFQTGSFPAASFELVTCFHVLEHISDPSPFLNAIRQVLRPHGLLYLKTPNLACIQKRQLNAGHVVLYSRDTLIQLLERNGLRVVTVWDNGPGGMKTFDQLGVVATPIEATARGWYRATTLDEARGYFEHALKSNFPYPSRQSFRSRMFRMSQMMLGDTVSSTLKRTYRGLQSRIRSGNIGRDNSAGALRDISILPAPLRDAFCSGALRKRQLMEIRRLPDEFVQLKVLSRVLACRLSDEQTQRLVHSELAHSQRDIPS